MSSSSTGREISNIEYIQYLFGKRYDYGDGKTIVFNVIYSNGKDNKPVASLSRIEKKEQAVSFLEAKVQGDLATHKEAYKVYRNHFDEYVIAIDLSLLSSSNAEKIKHLENHSPWYSNKWIIQECKKRPKYLDKLAKLERRGELQHLPDDPLTVLALEDSFALNPSESSEDEEVASRSLKSSEDKTESKPAERLKNKGLAGFELPGAEFKPPSIPAHLHRFFSGEILIADIKRKHDPVDPTDPHVSIFRKPPF